MTGTKRSSHFRASRPGGQRCLKRIQRVLLAFGLMSAGLPSARAAERSPTKPPGDGAAQQDQFVDPDLYCEYQITRVDTDSDRATLVPALQPQLLAMLPAIPWQNIVRVHVDCWVPRRTWSSLRHLLEGGYHDRLFGMISSAYLVKHLQKSAAGSLADLRVYQYMMDCFSSNPEKGQKTVPRKILEEVRLGVGAQLIARSLSAGERKELTSGELPALWKKAAPVLGAPDWTPGTLTQLRLLTDAAVHTVEPFWHRGDSIVEGDSFLLQRYAFYRGPSSMIRPRPLTQAWDLLHLRSISHECNELVPGSEQKDRTDCAPSTISWEKIAGQSQIQHTVIEAKYARHGGVEGTQVAMDWVWDFSYVMLPFNLQIVKDTIKAYFRSLIRGFYTLPRE